MIKDFETVKNQLQELSTVLNNFKSESVQLRILELLFKGVKVVDDIEEEDDESEDPPKKPSSTKKSKRKRVKKTENGEQKKKSTPRSGKLGPWSALDKLVSEGFFKTGKTIGDIVEHSKNNLATTIKSSDISGKLASLVRSSKLKRIRNKENQYEYSNA